MTDLRDWTFAASTTDPSGINVECTIAVPESVAWQDVRECAEIAQTTANRAAAAVFGARTVGSF